MRRCDTNAPIIDALNAICILQELEETRRKRQVEMTTVSRQLETEYQAKLQEQLQAMRADRDARIASNRREIEDLYKVLFRVRKK
jgi:hypothetical protein